jgi:hypothetical protein
VPDRTPEHLPETPEWTLETATAALPRVREVVRRVRELIAEARAHGKPSGNGQGPTARMSGDLERELRSLIGQLTAQGIIVRDPARGLIDFPARSPSGRPYLLCWLDGEDSIEWWHWPETGFAGRTPLSEPPT